MAFERFSGSHFAALALIVAGAALFSVVSGRCDGEGRRRLERLLAATIGVWEFVWLGLSIWQAEPASRVHLLPFQLCDFSLAAALIALAFRPAWAIEFAYYLGVAGSLQALITPELTADAWSWGCCRFMGAHGVTAAVACYFIFVRKYPLTGLSALRAYAGGYFYLCVAALVNSMFATNYGFVCNKPVSGSLMDSMGGWPLYLVWMQAAALVMVLMLHGMAVLARTFRQQRRKVLL